MAVKILEWMEREGMTKSRLAELLGMSRPTLYSRIEDGAWSLEDAFKLSRLIGCTVDDLVGCGNGEER